MGRKGPQASANILGQHFQPSLHWSSGSTDSLPLVSVWSSGLTLQIAMAGSLLINQFSNLCLSCWLCFISNHAFPGDFTPTDVFQGLISANDPQITVKAFS